MTNHMLSDRFVEMLRTIFVFVVNSLQLILFTGCLVLGWLQVGWLVYMWFSDSRYRLGSGLVYFHLIIMIVIAFYGSFVVAFNLKEHIKAVSLLRIYHSRFLTNL